jgi:hypothetical protein
LSDAGDHSPGSFGIPRSFAIRGDIVPSDAVPEKNESFASEYGFQSDVRKNKHLFSKNRICIGKRIIGIATAPEIEKFDMEIGSVEAPIANETYRQAPRWRTLNS